jgi:hypothetical protein
MAVSLATKSHTRTESECIPRPSNDPVEETHVRGLWFLALNDKSSRLTNRPVDCRGVRRAAEARAQRTYPHDGMPLVAATRLATRLRLAGLGIAMRATHSATIRRT